MIKRKNLVLLIIGAMLIGAIFPSYLLFGWENIYYNDDYAVRVPGDGRIPHKITSSCSGRVLQLTH